jgi:hypothetical protein
MASFAFTWFMNSACFCCASLLLIFENSPAATSGREKRDAGWEREFAFEVDGFLGIDESLWHTQI